MTPHERELERIGRLAAHLELLASGPRLQLLHQLRRPTRVADLTAVAGLSREAENPARPLSRQSLTHHLEMLLEAGLAQKTPGSPEIRGAEYTLNRERLFAVVDQLRSLTRLRSYEEDLAPGRTLVREDERLAKLPDPPRLVVAYGAEDGVAFGLPVGANGPLQIGRDAACEVRIDYDPYVSGVHARLLPGEGGFALEDAGSRNGTWVNHERVGGRPRGLRSGDLVRVGHSVLVYQI